MPLMKKIFPSRNLGVERPSSRTSNTSSYASFEYEEQSGLDSDMEGSIMTRPRSEKQATIPALPPRSSKRSSAMLNTVMSELKGMDGFAVGEKDVDAEKSEDPHESYLSSEEDASLSDDYADSLFDFDSIPASEYNVSRTSSRCGEDTARVVSFIAVSKPKVIEIPRPTVSHSLPTSRSHRDPQQRHSVPLTDLTPKKTRSSRQSSPLRDAARPISVSSMSALPQINTSTRISHKPSKLNTFLQPESATSNPSPSHPFLSHDPFPSPVPSPLNEQPPMFPEPEFQSSRPKSEYHERPKTPNSSLMEGMQGLTRTLTRSAKKRPSIQKLNLGVMNFSNPSRTSFLRIDEHKDKGSNFGNMKRSATAPLVMKDDTSRAPGADKETRSAVEEKAPVRYEDIMKTVIKEAPPKTPSTPSWGFKGFGMGNRRKSMKK